MSNININNFKAGLDTRRSVLSSQPGTLMLLNNAHINEGGEVEKRKAFFRQPLPSQTYGLLATGEEILTFGSRQVTYASVSYIINSTTDVIVTVTSTGTTPIVTGDYVTITGATSEPALNGTWLVSVGSGAPFQSQFIELVIAGATHIGAFTDPLVISSYFPTPVVFQQLLHPVAGVNMTGVTTATLFDDSAFVVTTWDNGDVLEFYNGFLVTDFTTGELNNISPTAYAMVTALVAQINASGLYTATQDALPTFLSFTIIAGTASPGVNTVGTTGIGYDFGRQVLLDGTETDIFDLLNGGPPVDWITSNVVTATNVVTAINGNPFGFVASNGGGTSNQINIVPPAVDDNGNPVGLQGTDSLGVQPGGDVQLVVPPNSSTFEVFSIPTTTDVNPYTVSTVVENASLAFQLVSSGIPATLAANAAGQFTIIAGQPNALGTGTLTISSTGPINNDTVTIGSGANRVIYTFVTFLTSAPNQVFIDSTIDKTLGNLVSAINGSSGAGTAYSSGTLKNALVTAAAVSAHATLVTAINNGIPGNVVASEASTNVVWSGLTAGNLTGGTDVNKITQIAVGATNLLSAEVPFNQNVNQTANDIVVAINAFQGTSGFNATANANTITISTVVPGTVNNEAIVTVTCAGGVAIANCFFFVSGSAGITITGITAAGTQMMSGTVTWTGGITTINQFATAVAANINAFQATGHFCAVAVANQIWLSPTVSTSSDGSVDVEVSGTAVILSGTAAALTVTNNTNSIGFVLSGTARYVSVNNPNSAVVSAVGGTPPYTYKWASLTSPSQYKPQIVASSPNQWWSIQETPGLPSQKLTVNEQWACTVTDSAAIPVVTVSPIFFLSAIVTTKLN